MMTELPQTLSDMFQRLTESNLPLFSWYGEFLNHPERTWFLLIAFGVGAILGLGFNLYRDHIRNEYVTFGGFPLMLIPTLIGAVSAVLVYLFIVPLLYVAILSVILFIVWDGIEQFYAAVCPIFCWNAVGIFGSMLMVSGIGYIIWFFVTHWSTVVANWTMENTIMSIVCVLLLSILFGLLRHHYYRDTSKLVSSSYFRTMFRYLHINLFWALWRVFSDLAETISERKTVARLALVTEDSEWVVNHYKFQLDMMSKDTEQSAEEAGKRNDALRRQVNEYKRELYRVREENKILTDKVAELGAAVTTLNEQNVELHQQWVDALQNTGIVDDGVVDLDDLFTDED